MDTQRIENQFNLIAEEYDKNRRNFIPCFEDYYISTTKFLAEKIKNPKCIVDLGSGTGLLAYYWYQKFQSANYMLVDIAEDMLSVAKRRFNGLKNFSYQVCDYKLELPKVAFDVVISALSIHHLEDHEKLQLFKNLYETLPIDGTFVNYDQFCAGDPELDDWYDQYWESQLYQSGLTKKDIELWQERRKFDRECSVEKEVELLKTSGFKKVKCIYGYHKFAVILAIK